MTADGQPACTPASTISASDRFDEGIAQAVAGLLGRRRLLEAAAGGMATLLLAACGTSQNASSASNSSSSSSAVSLTSAGASGSPTQSTASISQALSSATSSAAASATSAASGSAAASGTTPWVYVFNTGSNDVSIIDSATQKVLSTRPLGATVRWLSNEQRYWDGQHIWSYDFPGNKLVAIAIDPKAMKVATTVDTGTTGPGHSLMLTPDKQTALVNAAGSNVINMIDVAKGAVTDKIDTGKFP
ncbi:MAG TPA: hypothetical protein VGP33_09320 [Chloroflexota bacterium]|nr:hypothetical protein [Chloroflexota bacterium]